ncbi:hypothetical protein AVEN_184550-1, partial [Araneus ventricosus]
MVESIEVLTKASVTRKEVRICPFPVCLADIEFKKALIKSTCVAIVHLTLPIAQDYFSE